MKRPTWREQDEEFVTGAVWSRSAEDPAPAEESPQAEDSPDAGEAPSEEAATLVIPADLSGYIDYDVANAAFLDKFPNVTLEPGMGYWDAHDEPAFLAAADEAVNDVLTAGDEYPDTYGPRGNYLDMRQYLEADADLWFDDE